MNERHTDSEKREHLHKKKELLYRKAHGKVILDSYLSKVAYIFPSEVQPKLLSLEETDAILEHFRIASTQIHKESTRIFAHELRIELLAIQKSGETFYVLIDDDWKYCGAIKIDHIEKLNTSAKFADIILNDLFFISSDMSMAVSLDFFEMNDEYFIDIDKWCKTVQNSPHRLERFPSN